MNISLRIESVDHAPDDLYAQTPFVVDLIRQLPGPDRPDYWLGKLSGKLILWETDQQALQINYLVIATHFAETEIRPGVGDLPVGIAYVLDHSLLVDEILDFDKCEYVALGIAADAEERIHIDNSLLKAAKKMFLNAGLSTSNNERHEKYARAVQLFDEAAKVTPLSERMERMMNNAKKYSAQYGNC